MAIKFDHILFSIRKRGGEWFASTKSRQRFSRLPSLQTCADSCTVLASLCLYPAQCWTVKSYVWPEADFKCQIKQASGEKVFGLQPRRKFIKKLITHVVRHILDGTTLSVHAPFNMKTYAVHRRAAFARHTSTHIHIKCFWLSTVSVMP